MKTPPPTGRQSEHSACKVTREWIALGLGTAAGVGFICQCLAGIAPFETPVLLLFLCLTLLGRMTALQWLVKLVQAFRKEEKKLSRPARKTIS